MIADIIKHTIDSKDASITSQAEILSTGTEISLLDVGVIKFEPNTACDTSLIISCAIHGNETAPQEVVKHIIDDLLQEKQKCAQRILFIFGNPWAMASQQRFVDINLNRLFCEAWQYQDLSLKEVKRAAKLEACVADFFAEEPSTVKHRIHYDCHTSIRPSVYSTFAVYPFVENRQIPDTQLAFLSRANIQSVILQQKPTSTFSSLTSVYHGAQSFTLELGKVRRYGENDLRQFSNIDSSLRELIAGKALPDIAEKPVDVFEVSHEIIRTGAQWQFYIDEDAPNFTAYEKGYTIWQDEQKKYSVAYEREYIAFPNANVPIGQRAGLMLVRKQDIKHA